MKQAHDLELRLFGCDGVASFDDVVSVAGLMRDLGCVFVETVGGANQVASDNRTFLEERSFDFVSRGVLSPAQLESPAQELQRWGGLCAPVEALHSEGGFGACRRLGNAWDLQVRITTDLLRTHDESVSAAVSRWAALLERLGDALYERIRPELGVLFATQPSDMRERVPAFLQRRLFVGWRTWYGPAYVEAYGQDVLLGLPDRAEALDGGGVRHKLAADPVDLVAGEKRVHAAVFSYLKERGLQPAWPRMPRPKSDKSSPRRQRSERGTADDRKLDRFQKDVRRLLSTVAVLKSGVRVLMLPVPWSLLGPDEQAILVRHLLYAVQSAMTDHPGGRVHIEFEEIPADLWDLLEKTYPPGGPVSFGLLTDEPTA